MHDYVTLDYVKLLTRTQKQFSGTGTMWNVSLSRAGGAEMFIQIHESIIYSKKTTKTFVLEWLQYKEVSNKSLCRIHPRRNDPEPNKTGI